MRQNYVRKYEIHLLSHRKKILCLDHKKNLLLFLREIEDIYSAHHTENITTPCEINLELFNVQGSGTHTDNYVLKVNWKI